jgi:G6PDH family F420-dependent oxidoreductase
MFSGVRAGHTSGMRIGYFLSSEEFTPAELIEQATLAERAGFEALWISDHFHPWNDAQGQSAFVWTMVGAIGQACRLPITTAVTCPTVRIHPAIIAQAAATSAVLLEGRFILGVGSGEALNEHIYGDAWPSADIRLEMLEEAVEVMRKLWEGGFVDHRGRYYQVEHARVYTLPEQPVPVYVSAFGPKALDLAARIGDGYVSTKPDGDLVRQFREKGGGDKPAQGGFKACYAATEEEAVEIAYERWPHAGAEGELDQVLPSPRHFEQVGSMVPKEAMRTAFALGPDPERQLEQMDKYQKAGYDEVYVANVGPYYREFFDLYSTEVLPRLR